MPLTIEAIRRIFAARIREARLAAGYATTTAFAAELGVTHQAVGQWERGEAVPGVAQQVAIAELLSEQHSKLFGLDEPVA